jgi:hypothetical protein
VSRYIQIISILNSLWGFRNSMKTMKTIGRYYLWRQDLTGFCWYEYVLWRPALWRWKAAPWPYHPGTSSATTWASWQSILNVISPKTGTTQGLKNGKSYPWWYNFKTTVYLVDNIFFQVFVNQCYGSTDPDPKKIFTDPQHRRRFRSWNKHSGPGFEGEIQQNCW